jgi:serine/threonine protein kinase
MRDSINSINKIKYPEVSTENNEHEIVSKYIEDLEANGIQIGEGRTAKILVIREGSKTCLKVISEKEISCNSVEEEMRFSDLLSSKGFKVPRPVCAINSDKNDYFFMEAIQGFSLRDLIEKDLISELPQNFDFKKFFASLRLMIEGMHDEKIYHRDLHDGNVMIDKEGEPVVIDFGDAIELKLSSEDPYRQVDVKNEATIYTDDIVNISRSYAKVGGYLKEKNYFKNLK